MTNTNEISIVKPDLNVTIETFEKIKDIATYVATSDAFVKGFEMKDEAGKIIIDTETGKPKVNVADIAICIMTGHEIGLNLAGSLLYGKKLNQATYMSVMKGRSLGVDVATAIEKVVSIPTKNGYVSYTMVDIISAKLLQANIQFLPFIKNFAPFYIYKDNNGNELELDKILDADTDELLSQYAIVNIVGETPDSIKEQVKIAKDSGKNIVTRERHGYYSKAKFVRTYEDGRIVIHYQRFTSQDAERANLLPTWDDKGALLDKGKDNWISNTPQMMNNRVISIGGRIIGADLLNGVYTREEIVSSGIVDEKEAPIVDAEIVS